VSGEVLRLRLPLRRYADLACLARTQSKRTDNLRKITDAEWRKVMMANYDVPEDDLLSAGDAWDDYLSLKQALNGEGEPTEALPASPETLTLVRELVKAGVCPNEAEVTSRAIRAFFVAVFPREAERQRVLRETSATHRPKDSG
jgi:hypothetical protein